MFTSMRYYYMKQPTINTTKYKQSRKIKKVKALRKRKATKNL